MRPTIPPQCRVAQERNHDGDVTGRYGVRSWNARLEQLVVFHDSPRKTPTSRSGLVAEVLEEDSPLAIALEDACSDL